MTIQEQDWSF